MRPSRRGRATRARFAVLSAAAFIVASVHLLATSQTALAGPADLDFTFGVNGQVTTDVGGDIYDSGVEAIIRQPDGKLVGVGDRYSDFAIVRWNPDGSLDASLGDGGRVITTFSEYAAEGANAVVLQPDGKIVAAGNALNNQVALARYNPDGTLDTSFDGDGKVTTNSVVSAMRQAPCCFNRTGSL